jgi:hypothetical protein
VILLVGGVLHDASFRNGEGITVDLGTYVVFALQGQAAPGRTQTRLTVVMSESLTYCTQNNLIKSCVLLDWRIVLLSKSDLSDYVTGFDVHELQIQNHVCEEITLQGVKLRSG